MFFGLRLTLTSISLESCVYLEGIPRFLSPLQIKVRRVSFLILDLRRSEHRACTTIEAVTRRPCRPLHSNYRLTQVISTFVSKNIKRKLRQYLKETTDCRSRAQEVSYRSN